MTRYAWMAVGAATCLLAIVAAVRLWDVGAARGQTETPEPARADKASPPPAKLPPIKSDVVPPPPPETAPPPELKVLPVKADLPAPPAGPPGLPGVDVLPGLPAPGTAPKDAGPEQPMKPVPPPPADAVPPPTGTEERPIIIPGKATPKMVPVVDPGKPLPPLADEGAAPTVPPAPEEKMAPKAPGKFVPSTDVPVKVVKPPVLDEKPRGIPKPKVVKVNGRSYTVRATGMTVKDVAREALGSVERWPEVCKMNPGLTENGPLSEGSVVALPSASSGDTSVTPLPSLRARPAPKPRAALPLTGTFTIRMDDKGNLTLPRAVLTQLGRASTVMISPGSDRCLWLTSQAHLDRLSAKLDRSPARESDVRSFKRLYYAQTVKVPLAGDKAHVSARLAAFAGLAREVVLVGIDDHFEVWDSARWRKYTEANKARPERE